MHVQLSERHWLDASETIGAKDLCRSCFLTQDELDELVGYGVLEPLRGAGDDTMFRADCVPPLRTAARLGRLHDLDMFTVGLLLGYLMRIDVLERNIKTLQALVPAHLHPRTGSHEGPAPWREPHAKASAWP